MKRWLIWTLIVILIVGAGISIYIKSVPKDDSINLNKPEYICNAGSDCISTCGMGCVNREFSKTYQDSCINVRAFDCSCVNNVCYSDGQPWK